jgi:cation transport ATPase
VSARFWGCLVLTLLVAGLAMALPQLGGHVYSPAAQRWGAAAQFAVATAAIVWGGWNLLASAWRTLHGGKLDTRVLALVALAHVHVYVLIAAAWPGALPPALRIPAPIAGAYFVACAALATLAALVARRRDASARPQRPGADPP